MERRLRLLTDHIDKLRTAFRDTRRHHPFTIAAMVVLPDRPHLIWSLPEGDADFYRLVLCRVLNPSLELEEI